MCRRRPGGTKPCFSEQIRWQAGIEVIVPDVGVLALAYFAHWRIGSFVLGGKEGGSIH